MTDFNANDLYLFIPKMMHAVKLAKKKRKEHGFVVCKDGDQLIDSEMCVGEEHCVQLKPCGWGNYFLEFHTHSKSSIILPSVDDVVGDLKNRTDFVCIGLPRGDGFIRCYQYDNENPKLRDLIYAYNNVDNDPHSRMKALSMATDFTKPVKEWKNFIKHPL